MSKAWSKATAEQRANHRKRCQEAGKRRRLSNCYDRVCEEKIDSEGLMFILLAAANDKPMGGAGLHRMADLLKQKKTALEAYQIMFDCQS